MYDRKEVENIETIEIFNNTFSNNFMGTKSVIYFKFHQYNLEIYIINSIFENNESLTSFGGVL